MKPSPYIRLDTTLAVSSDRPHWNADVGPAELQISCDAATRRTTLTALTPALHHLEQEWADPLAALAWLGADPVGLLTRAGDRWIGYLSYDLGRLFERIPSGAVDDLGLPLFRFTLHRPEVVARSDDRLIVAGDSEVRAEDAGLPSSTFSRMEYQAAVARAIEYIRAGDIFQVNLSQRFSLASDESARVIYQRLMNRSPAQYGALLEYGDFSLISNSPELFMRVTREADGGRRIMTRPIKGTRPHGAGMERELAESIKDQAELNMIVDLERNDLGRVCEIGSVRVTHPRTIESHPTVFHGVATVEGMLREKVGLVELLRATFPGGSITGAPKIRAMEIIDQLEPVRRGPYSGAIGYLSAVGNIELNVAIRTMILKDGRVYVPVGGGVVADSTPAGEYAETLVKARAMFEALGVPL